MIVFDDREEFATKNRFPDADDIHVCPEFAGVFNGFDLNADDYIVIMTRGHQFDKEALAQALNTGAGYIGMIGSRKTRTIQVNLHGILKRTGHGLTSLPAKDHDLLFCTLLLLMGV